MKIEIAPEKEHQKINNDPVYQIADCDQQDRELNIFIEKHLFEDSACESCQEIDQGIEPDHIPILDINEKP